MSKEYLNSPCIHVDICTIMYILLSTCICRTCDRYWFVPDDMSSINTYLWVSQHHTCLDKGSGAPVGGPRIQKPLPGTTVT